MTKEIPSIGGECNTPPTVGFTLGICLGLPVVGGENAIQRPSRFGILVGISVVAGANSCNGILVRIPVGIPVVGGENAIQRLFGWG